MKSKSMTAKRPEHETVKGARHGKVKLGKVSDIAVRAASGINWPAVDASQSESPTQ
jgi:hypothetical protein